jgi:hypothetical protein
MSKFIVQHVDTQDRYAYFEVDDSVAFLVQRVLDGVIKPKHVLEARVWEVLLCVTPSQQAVEQLVAQERRIALAPRSPTTIARDYKKKRISDTELEQLRGALIARATTDDEREKYAAPWPHNTADPEPKDEDPGVSI